jgi:hypothetical protein
VKNLSQAFKGSLIAAYEVDGIVPKNAAIARLTGINRKTIAKYLKSSDAI